MREIKFRFWDGKAILPMDYVDSCIAGLSIFKQDKIIPMQFTGIHDKNGKEIYEGDIVEYYRPKEGTLKKVSYPDRTKRRAIKWEEYNRVVGFNIKKSTRDKYYIVLGNIYSNPELLTNN